MDCDIAAERLGPWIDRQLSTAEAAALEAHLATCAECRSSADALRAQDADLLRAFQPARTAAARVAAAVVERLHESPPAASPTSRLRPGLAALLLAAAAGFLLAIPVVRFWDGRSFEPAPAPLADSQSPVQPAVAGSRPTERPAVELAAARLVVATGDVWVRNSDAAAWQMPADLQSLVCPSDGCVWTGTNVRCELKTADGAVIRLNFDTEVRFPAAGVVEVRRGQVACSSPADGSLKVVVPERVAASIDSPGLPAATSPTGPSPTGPALGTTSQPAATTTASVTPDVPASSPPAEFMCRAQSSFIAAIEPDGHVHVTSSAGDVALQTPAGPTPLKQGESVRLISGRIVPADATDPILAAGWIGPLLVRKGYDDPELARRVDALLARMGRSKLAYLYEDEIRALGEYAVLPLLKFVESPESRADPPRRYEAVRLAADLAPTWAVTDLIDLLSDADPQIRFHAAVALHRLTGTDQGREPARWRVDLKQCEPTIDLWRKWRQAEPNRFPPRKPDRQT